MESSIIYINADSLQEDIYTKLKYPCRVELLDFRSEGGINDHNHSIIMEYFTHNYIRIEFDVSTEYPISREVSLNDYGTGNTWFRITGTIAPWSAIIKLYFCENPKLQMEINNDIVDDIYHNILKQISDNRANNCIEILAELSEMIDDIIYADMEADQQDPINWSKIILPVIVGVIILIVLN